MVEIMKVMEGCSSSMESKAQSGWAAEALAQLDTAASAEVCSSHLHREVGVSSMYRLAVVVVVGCNSRQVETVEVGNWQWWSAAAAAEERVAAAKVCCKGCHRLST